MDKNALIIFQADVNAQIQLIATIEQKLQKRSQNLEPDDIIRLEGIAYQIHNLYGATEDLLKKVYQNCCTIKLILRKNNENHYYWNYRLSQ